MADAQRKLEELESVFTGLAHESRRHILMVIWFRGGTMSAGDIAKRFRYSWPTISRHLRVLEQAGLLTHEKQGRIRLYRLNMRKIALAQEWLGWFKMAEQTKEKPLPGEQKEASL